MHAVAAILTSLVPALALGGLVACDGSPTTVVELDAAVEVDAATPRADAGACGEVVRLFDPVASPHVAETTQVNYGTNPPSSGPHFARWARWNLTYDEPVLPREHWVHNLEHGGVVLLYNCAAPCPQVIADLEALGDALPADAKCAPPLRTRTIIARDPELPAGVQIAASAWGATYTAACLDAASLRAFYQARVGKASEDTCAQGSAP